ncbi:hypothetical protein HDU77_010767 [Chytriomyces hyalinus]|nr:hypothetical protein HDU77_010767 [Chytriomyces hyalinus]
MTFLDATCFYQQRDKQSTKTKTIFTLGIPSTMQPTPRSTLRSKRHSLLATTTKTIFSLWAKPSVALLKKALPLCIECRKAYLVTAAGHKPNSNAPKSTPKSFLALVRRNPSSPAVHEVEHHVDHANCTNCVNIAALSNDTGPSNDLAEVVSEQEAPVSDSTTPSLKAPETPHESPSFLSMTREPNSPIVLSDIPEADLSFGPQETGNDFVDMVSEQEAPVSDPAIPSVEAPETPHELPSILSTARIPEVDLGLVPQEAEESHSSTATTKATPPYLVEVVAEQDGPVSTNNTPFLEAPETPHESPSILSTAWEPRISIVFSDIPEIDPASVPQEIWGSQSTATTEPVSTYKPPAMQHHRAKSEPTRQYKKTYPRKRVTIHNGSKKEHQISNKNQPTSTKQSLPSPPEMMSPPQKQTSPQVPKRKPSQLKRRMSVASSRVSNWFTLVKSKFRRRSAF